MGRGRGGVDGRGRDTHRAGRGRGVLLLLRLCARGGGVLGGGPREGGRRGGVGRHRGVVALGAQVSRAATARLRTRHRLLPQSSVAPLIGRMRRAATVTEPRAGGGAGASSIRPRARTRLVRRARLTRSPRARRRAAAVGARSLCPARHPSRREPFKTRRWGEATALSNDPRGFIPLSAPIARFTRRAVSKKCRACANRGRQTVDPRINASFRSRPRALPNFPSARCHKIIARDASGGEPSSSFSAPAPGRRGSSISPARGGGAEILDPAPRWRRARVTRRRWSASRA